MQRLLAGFLLCFGCAPSSGDDSQPDAATEDGGEVFADVPADARTDAEAPPDAEGGGDADAPADRPAEAEAEAEAGAEADVDAEAEADAGPREVTLLRLDGDVFTPTAAETVRTYDVGERDIVYDRVDVSFDFHTVDWQPEIPDEGAMDRTEHILFGLFRDNRPRTDERYLMGAAAVTFASRSPHFRMFGRITIGAGYTTYTSDSASYAWELGRTYHLACSLDGVTHVQQCGLSLGGAVVATRTLDVAYLVPEEHLNTGFYVELGLPSPGDIEVSPLDWTFSNLLVTARLR